MYRTRLQNIKKKTFQLTLLFLWNILHSNSDFILFFCRRQSLKRVKKKYKKKEEFFPVCHEETFSTPHQKTLLYCLCAVLCDVETSSSWCLQKTHLHCEMDRITSKLRTENNFQLLDLSLTHSILCRLDCFHFNLTLQVLLNFIFYVDKESDCCKLSIQSEWITTTSVNGNSENSKTFLKFDDNLKFYSLLRYYSIIIRHSLLSFALSLQECWMCPFFTDHI